VALVTDPDPTYNKSIKYRWADKKIYGVGKKQYKYEIIEHYSRCLKKHKTVVPVTDPDPTYNKAINTGKRTRKILGWGKNNIDTR